MIVTSLLIAATQVGPNPTPFELEPLPVQKRDKEAAPDTPQSSVARPTAAGQTVAGNMAIIEGDYDKALALLSEAQTLANEEGRPRMASEIGLDRARALMMLGRNDEAMNILDTARSELPGYAPAWVISAVNARRMNDFAKAQALIEEAGAFAPLDPGVGLEAGTIAYMVGNDEAALRSWQSVIETAPASDEAEFAKQYIESAQLVATFGEESGR